MFRRIAQVCPVDYYWLWTPEGWTWGGNKPEQFAATTRDMQAALDALTAVGKPFTLATCGWVLGPQHDRGALDQFLPKDVPMSCINREVGHAADEPGFAKLIGRPKWVIPWMENDPDLIAPQPWVGRMRCDAVDASRLGGTGLLGIHWRTKILAPNVAALAAAAWDQSWVPADYWLNTYRYMAALAEVGCLRGELDRGQPVQAQLARAWERMLTHQIAATDTPGELGTLANLEQHNRVLRKFLGASGVALAKTYAGPARLIVPTVRTLVDRGEALKLKVIAIDKPPVKSVVLFWRPLGPGSFRKIDARHAARAVYNVALPAASGDFEYYFQAEFADGKELAWLATAPGLNQTVVVR